MHVVEFKNIEETLMQKDDVTIHRLFEMIIKEHAFTYTTLDNAKKTISVNDKYYCFDAFSLCYYNHNLNNDEFNKLKKLLTGFYDSEGNKEKQKERNERAVLFHYLNCKENQTYKEMIIEKRERPDFVLFGNNNVGIEVVELTTPKDKILERIAMDSFGRGMSYEQIVKAAKKHGAKSNDYYYYDLDGNAAISLGLCDIKQKQRHFAGQINGKYLKYGKMLKEFDEFIILCDVQKDIAVSSKDDTNSIIEYLKLENHSLSNVTVAILWEKDGETRVSHYIFD